MERLLPVHFKGKRKRRDLDLVLLIDRSHSMRGRKLELAKSAALATLDLLEDQHRLAVVAFDSRPHDVVPLARGRRQAPRRGPDRQHDLERADQHLRALAHAQQLLAGSTAATRHIILLSDGITAPRPGRRDSLQQRGGPGAGAQAARRDDASGRRSGSMPEPEPQPDLPRCPGGMERLVAELAAAKVTLSTIAIGDKPEPRLDA